MTLFRQCFVVLIIALVPVVLHAQKDVARYREQADVMRKEVWNWKMPAFDNRIIPSEYSNSSKVILARHTQIVAGGRKKTKGSSGSLGFYKEYNIIEINREAVKINDKAALDEYSEISFQQLQRKFSTSSVSITTSYIGVRIYKTNGTLKEVNTDEMVLTKNERTDKQAKVAIPDLQVGDVIDYFIATDVNTSANSQEVPSFSFAFFDSDPVLYSSVHCEVYKNYVVECRSYNGAPKFKVSDEDNMMIMDAEKKSIPPVTGNNLWTSVYRQLPLIRMNILMWRRDLNIPFNNIRKSGTVYANQDMDEFVEDELINIGSYRKTQMQARALPSKNMLDRASSNYIDRWEKNGKKLPKDSLAAEVFYLWRYQKLSEVIQFWLNNNELEKLTNVLAAPFNSNEFAFSLGTFYRREFHMPNQLILSTSKYGPVMKEAMSSDDFGYMVGMNNSTPVFMSAQDFFTTAFYIPYFFEDTKDAIAVELGSVDNFNPKYYDKSTIAIPGSTSGQNLHVEQMVVTPDLSKNEMQINRKTILTGHYKSDDQRKLALVEDYFESERKYYGNQKTLLEEYMDYSRKSKKFAEEVRAAFAKARSAQKDAFRNEASEWFEQDIRDMSQFKIENYGNRHTNPEFIYSSVFNMGGIVKKAGNNFIIDIGRLQGSPLKIESGQRNRSLDIFAPFARSIAYDIRFQVPEGYALEGVEKLNKSVENETGSFISSAVLEGSVLNLKVSKVYKHAYEPVSGWTSMLKFIDAANEWSDSKLLLRKK